MSTPSPFVALMRRYVEEYTNAHEFDVCEQIFHPDYRIHIGGATLGFDQYREMVRDAFVRFPDLQLVVHRFITNGDRLAMHFSEYATSPTHGHRQAVWEGIGLYRRGPDGRLVENFVEQDFYGRRVQLASDEPLPIPRQDASVWDTADRRSSEHTGSSLRAWVEARNRGEDQLNDAATKEFDGLLTHSSISIADLFSAGNWFGVRLKLRGNYDGSLYGVAEQRRGDDVALDAIAVGRVDGDGVAEMHMVSDRFGLRDQLKK